MSEALRLADELDALMDEESLVGAVTIDRAAAELRRLHALNAELVEALKAVYDSCSWGDEESYNAMEKARAALAKVEASK